MIEEVRDRLKHARSAAALTGAGISAESGIPTYRGADGLWKNFRAEDLATLATFERDPKTVWQWYDWRRLKMEQAAPNPAHEALARLEARLPEFWLITQNIDGLHQAAGSKRVLELHGNIWRTRCTACGKYREDRRAPLPEMPPKCLECRGLLRPDVVWFGELLPQGTFQQAMRAAAECDVFLVCGTAAVVEPAASLARLAKQSGAFVVECNLEPTPLTPLCDVVLTGKTSETLSQAAP